MINCSDCSDNRLFTLSVSPVTGLTADQPAAAPTADMAIRSAIRPTKIRTGSGRALPSRSTASRKRLRSSVAGGELTVRAKVWRDYTGESNGGGFQIIAAALVALLHIPVSAIAGRVLVFVMPRARLRNAWA